MQLINAILFAVLLVTSADIQTVEKTNTTIKVLDSLTSEELTGVKVEYNNTCDYTDFDGNITINIDDTSNCEISCISYETKTVSIKDIQDNVVTLNRLK